MRNQAKQGRPSAPRFLSGSALLQRHLCCRSQSPSATMRAIISGQGGWKCLRREKNVGRRKRRGKSPPPVTTTTREKKFVDLKESPLNSIQLTEKKSNPFKESPLSPQECSLGPLSRCPALLQRRGGSRSNTLTSLTCS